MAWLKKRLALLLSLLDALIEGSETVSYPETEMELPNGYRGAIQLDPEKCTGCGLCARDCPANALELVKESKSDYKLIYHPARCAYCGQCELSCHRGAISHSNRLTGSTRDPDSIVVILKEQKDQED
jgi:hydrogenase-4 component H/formate hydrogenlyase subunit 6